MLNYFLTFSTVLFFLGAIIWNRSDLFNVFLKFILAVMAAWGVWVFFTINHYIVRVP